MNLLSRLSLSVSFSFTLVFNELKSVFSTRSLATLLVNFATSVGIVPNFGISNLSTSVFKADKLVFRVKPLASTCVILSRSFLDATSSGLRSTVTCFTEDDSDKYLETTHFILSFFITYL